MCYRFAMSEWLPIETAPKDGTKILGYGFWASELQSPIENGPEIAVISYMRRKPTYEGYQWDVHGGEYYACWMKPTHWMPLPEEPDED